MRPSDWYEQYRTFYLWERIEEVQSELSEFQPSDDAETSHVGFLQLLLSQLLERRARPSLFVTEAMMDAADDGVIELRDKIATGSFYVPSRDANGNLIQTLYFPDKMMDAFSKWPVDSKENLRSAAQTLRYASEELTAQTQRFESLSEELEETITTKFEEHKTEVVGQITAVREEFAEIETSVEETTAAINALKLQTTNLIQNETNRFRDAEKDIQKELEEALKKSSRRVDNVIANHEAKLDALQQEMDGIKERGANMVRLVSTSFVSDAHRTEANAQQKAADEYRTRGVWALAAAAIIAVLFGADLASNESSDLMLAVRFSVTFTIGLIGWYLLRESARHREKEHDARTMELKLRALTPFIEGLDDKDKIIEAAAHYFFDINPRALKLQARSQDKNDLRWRGDPDEED